MKESNTTAKRLNVTDFYTDNELIRKTIELMRKWNCRHKRETCADALFDYYYQPMADKYLSDRSFRDPELLKMFPDNDAAYKYIKETITPYVSRCVKGSSYSYQVIKIDLKKINGARVNFDLLVNVKSGVFTIESMEANRNDLNTQGRHFPISMLPALFAYIQHCKSIFDELLEWYDRGLADHEYDKEQMLDKISSDAAKINTATKCEELKLPYRLNLTATQAEVEIRIGDGNIVKFRTSKQRFMMEVQDVLEDCAKLRDLYSTLQTRKLKFDNENTNSSKEWVEN